MAAFYTFEDLSGSTAPTGTSTSDNPYQALIEQCDDSSAQIQSRYNTHRVNRNKQQREKLLSPTFPGVTVDDILAKLEDPTIEPGFKDWRHCLVFWARPPERVRRLIADVQQRLLAVVPHLWLMPPDNLHMTALEITHSLTAAEIDTLVEQMLPSVPEIADYTHDHRARLVKPMLSYDAQALALSFLPAHGEPRSSSSASDRQQHRHDDEYTYHHLRRDLFDKAQATGVTVASRYVIPSAHLTIGRFIVKEDFEDGEGKVDHGKVGEMVRVIDEVNEWLEREFWPQSSGGDGREGRDGGEWVVGEEKGLECRKGALWYGSGGEAVYKGKGF